jgi:hypothetical protein
VAFLFSEEKTALATFESQGLFLHYEAIVWASTSLEEVLETELDDTRIDGCGGDLSERCVTPRSVRTSELGSIKGIVKLCPELESMPFSYHCVFDK